MPPRLRKKFGLAKKEPEPGNLEPLRGRPSKTDTALEGADVNIGILKGIAAFAPTSTLSNICDTALAIVETAKNIRDNKEAFKHLVDDAVNLVVTANDTVKRLMREDPVLPQDMLDDLEKMAKILDLIKEFALAKVARSVPERILYMGHDPQTIRRYREELGLALDRFNLAQTMTLRSDVANLRRGQTKILNHIERQNGTPDNTPHSAPPSIQLHPADTTSGPAVIDGQPAPRPWSVQGSPPGLHDSSGTPGVPVHNPAAEHPWAPGVGSNTFQTASSASSAPMVVNNAGSINIANSPGTTITNSGTSRSSYRANYNNVYNAHSNLNPQITSMGWYSNPPHKTVQGGPFNSWVFQQ